MVHTTLDILKKYKIIAIIRGIPPDQLLPLTDALRAGGIRMVEVTFDQTDPSCGSAAAIRHIASNFPDLHVGAGTVMTSEQVRLAHEAGAQYIISPNVCQDVIQAAKERNMLSLPGAFTPTEIACAHRLGADAVKVFPAGELGPSYIKAVRAPLKQIPLVAVGGVSEHNIKDFLDAGAIAAGVGGSLMNADWIKQGAFAQITHLAQKFVTACQTGGSI